MADRPRGSGWLPFVILISVFVVLGVTILELSQRPGASFTASIKSLKVINSARVTVRIVVVNTGDQRGTPTCAIDLESRGSVDWGEDNLIANASIPAGREVSYKQTMAVTNQGAGNITIGTSKVPC